MLSGTKHQTVKRLCLSCKIVTLNEKHATLQWRTWPWSLRIIRFIILLRWTSRDRVL